jgi:hypothetical protein
VVTDDQLLNLARSGLSIPEITTYKSKCQAYGNIAKTKNSLYEPDSAIIANASFQSTLCRHVYLRGSTGRSSMPRDLSVYNNFLTIFVHLDDRITPAQLRFNMSQLVHNFRPVWITPYERLI